MIRMVFPCIRENTICFISIIHTAPNVGPHALGTSAKPEDFVKWEQLPCALAPDTGYDGQGCFSGSAVEHEGKHILMYTGVREVETRREPCNLRQTQVLLSVTG